MENNTIIEAFKNGKFIIKSGNRYISYENDKFILFENCFFTSPITVSTFSEKEAVNFLIGETRI
jgi:hypothetical protein